MTQNAGPQDPSTHGPGNGDPGSLKVLNYKNMRNNSITLVTKNWIQRHSSLDKATAFTEERKK